MLKEVFSRRSVGKYADKEYAFIMEETREEKPEPIPQHRHRKYYEVYTLLDGEVAYRVEDEVFHLTSGDVLLISPLTIHGPLIPEGKSSYTRLVLMLHENLFQAYSTQQTDMTFCFDPLRCSYKWRLRMGAESLQQYYSMLRHVDALRNSGAYGDDIRLKLALVGILLLLNEEAKKRPEMVKQEDANAEIVQSVVQYINDNYGRTISLDSLAAHFYIDKYHLSREFRRYESVSVYKYLTRVRLAASKRMLLEGVSPKDTAVTCGFKDYSNFYRAFRSTYGCAPKEFADGEMFVDDEPVGGIGKRG